jgi:hypothetical protein
MFLEMLSWWYGSGWLDITRRIGNRVVAILHLFSVSILLGTLFAPWKRIVTPPGRSIEQILRGMVDNLVSRTIGFFVRISVLCIVVILTAIATVVGFVMVATWPLIPVAVIYSLYRGIAG